LGAAARNAVDEVLAPAHARHPSRRSAAPLGDHAGDAGRYLSHLRRLLFPIVEVVNKTGIPKPGAWTALAVERRLNWPLTPAEQMEEATLPREESLARIWRELIPEPEAPAGGGTQQARDKSQSERAVR
jgi:hypothetical protein